MAKLLIEVKCGTEACGDCRHTEATGPAEWACRLFNKNLGSTRDEDTMPERCPSCLAAERAALAYRSAK
jgi:hypothetical protein